MKQRFTLSLFVFIFVFTTAMSSVFAQTTQHRVQAGQTLSSIAALYGINPSTLAQVNGIVNANLIYVGQVLIIPAMAQPQTRIHVVAAGEYLSLIAQRYNVTVAALAAQNNILNTSRIYPGQRLVIPATGGPVVVTPLPTQPPTYNVYVVQPGDTMFRIAIRYSRSIYAIAQANNLLNLNQIYVGQQLVIP